MSWWLIFLLFALLTFSLALLLLLFCSGFFAEDRASSLLTEESDVKEEKSDWAKEDGVSEVKRVELEAKAGEPADGDTNG